MLAGNALLAIIAVAAAAPIQDQRCPADIVFVVDQSSSVTGHVYYSQVVPFLVNLTREFDIGLHADHIAFVPFATPADTEVNFFLDFSYEEHHVLEALKNQRYLGGSTATKKALSLVRNEVFLAEEGARMDDYVKKQVAPIVLIFTDGMATDGDPTKVAEALRSDGAKIFAVGAGAAVTKEFLIKITGNADHVFYVNDFAALDQALINDIISTTKC